MKISEFKIHAHYTKFCVIARPQCMKLACIFTPCIRHKDFTLYALQSFSICLKKKNWKFSYSLTDKPEDKNNWLSTHFLGPQNVYLVQKETYSVQLRSR
jgi:hypothetical protein